MSSSPSSTSNSSCSTSNSLFDRPFVVATDVCSNEELQTSKIIGLDNDVFALVRSISVSIFRYDWQARSSNLLYKQDTVGQRFTIIPSKLGDAMGVEIFGDHLLVHRIGESEMQLVDQVELKIGRANIEVLQYLKGSDGLLVLIARDRFILIRVASRTGRSVVLYDDTINVLPFSPPPTVDGSIMIKIITPLAVSTVRLVHRIVDTNCERKGESENEGKDQVRFVPIGAHSNPSDIHLLPAPAGGIMHSISDQYFQLPNVIDPGLKGSIQELIDLPTLGKGMIVHLGTDSFALYLLTIDRDESPCRLKMTRLPNQVERTFVFLSNYCPMNGTICMHRPLIGDTILLNLETMEYHTLQRGGYIDSSHLWLPRPTCRDMIIKYVPVLEAHTKLPTDLCRLIASYLDW